ncbi:Myb/SANT-like DNA-binding domain-containing protein [Phellopilus nigrolimitatus]|nr:Myb/SANT-like DNA-binding domain-containing protein [Phellopilus nigrolimitatus]
MADAPPPAPPQTVRTPPQFTPVPPPLSILANAPLREPTAQPSDKASRWTPRDDLLLADALVIQKSLGRNRDVVFTAEAWTAVAEHMKGSELMSGGAQKTVTQCKARWQRLKIEYRVVKHLRSQPGFSWDESSQMVVGAPALWDSYIAEHRDAQPWRKKAFAAYDRVKYLTEDENGKEYADNDQFKRRWNGSVQRQDSQADVPMSDGFSSTHPPGSGVFSISDPSGPSPPSVPMASPESDISIPTPFNGNGNGASQQYQISTPLPSSGKRRKSPPDNQQSATPKRTKSASSGPLQYPNGFAVASPPHVFPAPPPVPMLMTRMATAIQVVEETEGLPDDEFVRAVQLFQRRPEAADAYLAIHGKRTRSLYLKAEVEDFSRSRPG